MAIATAVKLKKVKQIKILHISPKNTKLGKIPSFSLPAILSCPGKTEWCSKACYAAKIERIYNNAAKAYSDNFAISNSLEFVELMNIEIAKLTKKGINTFRFHVSGDISTIKYMYDLLSIVKANPTMRFYAYTKSWRVPGFLPHLEIFRSQPNVELFASLDDEILALNEWPPNEWRVAYVGDKDINTFMSFSNKQTIACPQQKNSKFTCDKCKFCFNKILEKTTKSVYFIKH